MGELSITELSVDEVNLVLQALGEQPAKVTLDIILKIREQVQAQLQPPAANED